MKVCLVIPPSGFLLDERVFMSLGILKVASSLESRGITVELLDLSGVENYLDVVRDHLSNSDAKIFGITTTTPQLPAAVLIAQTVKMARHEVRTVLGGPHVTLVCSAWKQEQKNGTQGRGSVAMSELHKHFDVLVAGDGEEAIFIACSEHPPALIDADDRKSPLFLTNEQLTALPFPARHLVDTDSYHYQIDGKRAYSLIAQLGCPFECGFCGGRASSSLRKIRMRTADNIVAEMLHMTETMGNEGFMFYDDELNVNPGILDLMNRIADVQKERGAEWRLRGFVKAELFTDAQAEAMYRAGFRWILVGYESGSPRMLTNINKKATREENTRCVEIAHRHGLKVKALMSIGHPGETRESILETKEWLLEVKPDDFDVCIITCYPGTPYYDEAVLYDESSRVWVYTHKKTGDRLFQVSVDYTVTADYYKGNPDGGYQAYVYTDELSQDDLIVLRGEVEREVRLALGIPFYQASQSMLYEHSMGQSVVLPPTILRTSKTV